MTATPRKNPYRPGVGTRPLHLAGRDAELRRFRSALRAAPEIPANIRLTGLRGVGKTVLLSEFDRMAKEEEGWATAHLELEPRHNAEEDFTKALVALLSRTREGLTKAMRIRAKVGRVVEAAAKGLGVSYQDITVTFDSRAGSQGIDLSRALFDTVQAAVETGHTGLVLLLDEAQVVRDERQRDGEHPLSLLIAAVSALQKVELPLALVLCGLPTLTTNLLNARTYSERMFRGETIGSLNEAEAHDAFVKPLTDTGVAAEPDLVAQVLDLVEGYPYFIQLWGAELWDAAAEADVDSFTPNLLEAVEPEIYRRLDTDFYEPRVRTLTPAEQDVLVLGAQCPYPPLRVSDLNEASDKTPENVNVLLGRLVNQGVLFRVRKGQYEYTAPRFHEYLRRRSSFAPDGTGPSATRIEEEPE